MSAGQAGIRPLVAGNWKMNGLTGAAGEVKALREALAGPLSGIPADVMIAPPATLIGHLQNATQGSPLQLAGQDCHAKASGAQRARPCSIMARTSCLLRSGDGRAPSMP